MTPVPDEVLRQMTDSTVPWHGYALTLHSNQLDCTVGDLARDLLAARAALRGLLLIHDCAVEGRLVECLSDPYVAARSCLPPEAPK